jgi:hypothetical protein
MPARSTEKEPPLPLPLRAYTLLSTSSASPGNLSIVSADSTSELYTISIEPIIDMHHCYSITMCSPSCRGPIVGAVRMEDGCDTIDLTLGDSEEFGKHENYIREYMHIRHDELNITTYEFALGLGDDLRRDFKWCSVEMHPHSWSISKLLHGLARTHSPEHQKVTGKKYGPVTKGHTERGTNARRRCLKLIDCNAGETVAMVMCHMALVNGEIVNSDDIGDIDTRSRFVIFRDFWETGQHEESWDRMVLLSGLAVLDRADME